MIAPAAPAPVRRRVFFFGLITLERLVSVLIAVVAAVLIAARAAVIPISAPVIPKNLCLRHPSHSAGRTCLVCYWPLNLARIIESFNGTYQKNK